jgi:phosphoglycerate dehydrogenase-like enzyme
MFEKIVVLEPILITEEGKDELKAYSKEVVFYDSKPNSKEEIIDRIGGADCVLLSFTTKITKEILDRCNNIKYIGMSCSFYGEKYSNLDMKVAKEKGIVVKYLKDYGDEGVPEYIVSELIRLLHGLGEYQWKDRPYELTGIKTGIIGLGKIGTMVAKALKHFGANVYYYSKTRKYEEELNGIRYLELEELLQNCEIISTHLNRDVVLLKNNEFEMLGNGKIFINTTIGCCYDVKALKKWLDTGKNYHICDSVSNLPATQEIINHPRTIYTNKICGNSKQSDIRATNQTLRNIKDFFENSD